jgi:hypothetical protein
VDHADAALTAIALFATCEWSRPSGQVVMIAFEDKIEAGHDSAKLHHWRCVSAIYCLRSAPALEFADQFAIFQQLER